MQIYDSQFYWFNGAIIKLTNLQTCHFKRCKCVKLHILLLQEPLQMTAASIYLKITFNFISFPERQSHALHGHQQVCNDIFQTENMLA